MKAVILAAGQGSRLGAEGLPKPLFEIGPRSLLDPAPVSLLERQILCLRQAGVGAIAVVVGFLKEVMEERLLPLKVELIVNRHPDLKASGTTHSFQFAACSTFDPLGGLEPLLLLDGDLAYEQQVLSGIAGHQAGTRLLVAPEVCGDEEEVRVYGRHGEPCLLGKGLGPPVTAGLGLLGEAAGIIRFDPREHALVRGLLDWLVGRPGGAPGHGYAGIASEHEELSQYLMNLGALGAEVLPTGRLFMEVDFPAEFEKLRREVYPAILERDRP